MIFRSALTRATVTAASRIMLPTYVFATAAFGYVFLFDPLNRLRFQGALAVPEKVMGGSMGGWGVIFLLLSAVMASGLLTHKRFPTALGLCCLAVTCVFWIGMTCWSIYADPTAGLTAPIWWAVGAAASIASTKSIILGET